MRKTTLIVLLVIVTVIITCAVAMHGEGASRLHDWFREMHGAGRH